MVIGLHYIFALPIVIVFEDNYIVFIVDMSMSFSPLILSSSVLVRVCCSDIVSFLWPFFCSLLLYAVDGFSVRDFCSIEFTIKGGG